MGVFEFIAPVYDQMETNIPHTVMSYSDQSFPPSTALFPRHGVVLVYLKTYAQGLEPYIQYKTQVLDVRKLLRTWEVEVLNLRSKQVARGEFDAVIVASGHFNVPYVPDTHGLVDFDKAHPGIILQSKFYHRPDAYASKKLVVIGTSPPGVDLTAQLTKVAKLPVIISEKERGAAAEPATSTPSTTYLPEMEAWVTGRRQQRGEGRSIHLIKFPKDVQYLQRLYDLCQTATRDPGLFPKSDGVGKLPSLWDERKMWVPGKVTEIKQASHLAGGARHGIMTPEELGFDLTRRPLLDRVNPPRRIHQTFQKRVCLIWKILQNGPDMWPFLMYARLGSVFGTGR